MDKDNGKDKKISDLAPGGVGGTVILDGTELIPFAGKTEDGRRFNGAAKASQIAALAKNIWLIRTTGRRTQKPGLHEDTTGWSQTVAEISLDGKPVGTGGADRRMAPGDVFFTMDGLTAFAVHMGRGNKIGLAGTEDGIPFCGSLEIEGEGGILDVTLIPNDIREWTASCIDEATAALRDSMARLSARVAALEGPTEPLP